MAVKFFSIGLKDWKSIGGSGSAENAGSCGMVIVRVPDAPLKKAQEHVLASFYASVKTHCVLSPLERKKQGPMFDLAMAVGILKATGKLIEMILSNARFVIVG